MDAGRILYVRGIGRTISKEELTIYFQSRKQSGGGDISSIDLKEDEAIITFEEGDVAKNVGSKTHVINGTQVEVSLHPFIRETQSQETSANQTCVVIIRGLSQNTTEDALLNYFENTRRSGGGDVEEVNIKGDLARIKFESAEAANRVVAHDKHSLNGATLDVSLEVRDSDEEKGKTIKVAGLAANTTEDSIWNYFENKRHSRGGEVETVDLQSDTGVAFVTFEEVNVVNSVLQRNKHALEGVTLSVTACNNTCGLPDKEEAQESRTIEVTGLAPTTTKDSITMYFENTRRSGGRKVEHVDFKPDLGIAVVTFVKAETANRVVAHDKHSLNGATLDVSLEVRDSDEEKGKTIKVAGLAANTTEDSIWNYFENKRRSRGGEVETVDLQSDTGVAFVTFEEVNVVNSVLQRNKHALEGVTLSVTACNNTCGLPDKEEAQESRTIEVTGLAPTTTKDSITMYFENTRRSGGGKVEHVDFKPDLGIAVVTFVKAESQKKIFDPPNPAVNETRK